MQDALSLNPYSIRQFFLGLLISLSVISCVTINIYFPAAAAEEAAEKIVDEILNIDTDETKPKPQSFYQSKSNNFTSVKNYNNSSNNNTFIVSIIDIFIPADHADHAAQANISIETAKIRSIHNSMGKRQAKSRPFYQSSVIGFTNNGLIAITGVKGLSAKQKATANKLIKSENNDRNKLYKEIANDNGHPEWQSDIQKTFSHTWINKISAGWMYQTSS